VADHHKTFHSKVFRRKKIICDWLAALEAQQAGITTSNLCILLLLTHLVRESAYVQELLISIFQLHFLT
jgi:hypothetical protein